MITPVPHLQPPKEVQARNRKVNMRVQQRCGYLSRAAAGRTFA